MAKQTDYDARDDIQNIIDRIGFDGFLRAEEKAVLSVSASNCVIATGGSVVYSRDGMAHLKENGVVVYLDVGLDEIKRRLTNIETRGIVLRPGQTLDLLYDERTRLCRNYADITVPADGLTAEETVTYLADLFENGR